MYGKKGAFGAYRIHFHFLCVQILLKNELRFFALLVEPQSLNKYGFFILIIVISTIMRTKVFKL